MSTQFKFVRLAKEMQDPALVRGSTNTRDEFSAPAYGLTLDDNLLTVTHTESGITHVVPWSSVLYAIRLPVAASEPAPKPRKASK
jgi:hypothetical protein